MNEFMLQLADLIADRVILKMKTETGPVKNRKRLLTAKEAADYLGRSWEAIKHLTARGELPTVRAGRRVHYAIEDLDRWIAENKV